MHVRLKKYIYKIKIKTQIKSLISLSFTSTFIGCIIHFSAIVSQMRLLLLSMNILHILSQSSIHFFVDWMVSSCTLYPYLRVFFNEIMIYKYFFNHYYNSWAIIHLTLMQKVKRLIFFQFIVNIVIKMYVRMTCPHYIYISALFVFNKTMVYLLYREKKNFKVYLQYMSL